MRCALIGLALLLAACAPKPPTSVGGTVTQTSVEFYPSQSGAIWQYLKEGERSDSPPYALKIEGPQSFNGRILTSMRFIGRGQDITYFRQFDETGVHLVSQGSTNFYELVYDQPVLEYPAKNDLVVGKSWSGTTLATFTPGKQAARQLRYTYQFRVLGKEKYKIGNVTYDAFLILRDNRLEDLSTKAEPIIESQRIRFVPFIGEVQTREGLILIGYNFKK
jgi:hypothetical protein